MSLVTQMLILSGMMIPVLSAVFLVTLAFMEAVPAKHQVKADD